MRSIALTLIALSLLVSCSKSDAVPAYIYVPDMNVATNYGTQGSESDNIADVWLYVDNNLQGAYQLPALIPVLAEGPTKLAFVGGVKLNGITNTRGIYPYYADTTITAELVPAQIDTFYPVVKYKNATQFLLKEDFENGNEFTNMQRSQVDVFEGNSSGQVVPEADRYFTVETNNYFDIDNYRGTVFIELDYKTSHVMTAGLQVQSANGGILIFKLDITPKEEWSKIYINFTPEVGQTQATAVKLFFDVNATNDTRPIDIFLDNVKILYL